jgi:hypothetical protein
VATYVDTCWIWIGETRLTYLEKFGFPPTRLAPAGFFTCVQLIHQRNARGFQDRQALLMLVFNQPLWFRSVYFANI